MTIQKGDILVLKITGEKVYVLNVDNSEITVRRAKQTNGGFEHVVESFQFNEVETFDAHLDAQVAENVKKGTKQLELMRAEAQLNKQFEDEMAAEEKVITFPSAKKETLQ